MYSVYTGLLSTGYMDNRLTFVLNMTTATKTKRAPIKYAVLSPSKKYILEAVSGPIVLANEPAERNNPRISP